MNSEITGFDPVRYKQTTLQQWESAAEAWHRWGPLLSRWLAEPTEMMLDMAGIGTGHRVLDVAAGAGDQAMVVASRVGPRGYVLATDISPGILEFAIARSREAGFDNVETRELDGENLAELEAGSFDAVISRIGMIYFPDLQRALAGMRHALREGGRVAAMVYSTAEKNAFFSVPVSVIRRRANLPWPLPGQPGPFSLGGNNVLENALIEAGFRDVEVRVVDAPLRVESATECLRFEKESFGALHQMLSGLSDEEKDQAWQEILERLGEFENREGFTGPCELVIAVATR
ncbi:MAG TPA: methyltransferase domain-containing protein [Thiolapillus brandeum]|uniref:Methyltransferase domain-containing protein n=1 Tax=Thiolapillus brandeum TaxID=1076588 RepID=A0A831WAX2_9GAMM|nr:methyltransferase domain-containing protein [Thiolapillus brandeum]